MPEEIRAWDQRYKAIFLYGYLKAAPAMKKGKNYLKPENQLLKLKFRDFKKLSPS